MREGREMEREREGVMHDDRGMCDEERDERVQGDQIGPLKWIWGIKSNWWQIQKLHVQAYYTHVHVYIT